MGFCYINLVDCFLEGSLRYIEICQSKTLEFMSVELNVDVVLFKGSSFELMFSFSHVSHRHITLSFDVKTALENFFCLFI